MPPTWLGAGSPGVLYNGLGSWFYLSGLRQVPASYAGASLPLIPVSGATTVFLVGERLEPWHWFGAAVIVTTTAFIARHETKFAQPSPRE